MRAGRVPVERAVQHIVRKGRNSMRIKPLWIVVLLACLAVVTAACQPIQPEAAPAQPAADQPGTQTVAPTDPADVQIANAMSAAPLVVAQDATILGYPVEEGGEMVVLREGTNGWTCYTDWPASPGNDPACYDAVFEALNGALFAGTELDITALGMGYMLAGGSDPSNTDPLAMEPAEGEDWIATPPHVMFVAPGGLDPAHFSTDHASGEPYIMWEGSPYEHLMMPVVPAGAPNGPLTADATAEEQIANMRSAAPAVIVDNATLMGYPAEEGGDMVVLQEGSNGWVCYPDRLVSPGDDPSCNDAAMEEGFATGATRDVTRLGLAYMLAGGSDESNTDPTSSGPEDPAEWITTPFHVMAMVPGGFDVANFTTDHTSGYPYIMFDDTDFEHLMIPVADLPAADTGE
jgi:hypothetical protein